MSNGRNPAAAVAGHVLHRAEREDGPEPVRALGDQQDQRAAGAVAAEVDAVRIDVGCLARKSAAASTSSTSPKNPSFTPGLSFPPRSDGNIMTMPGLAVGAGGLVVVRPAAADQTSPMELQSPPVIQMMAGCFLPSFGSGREVGGQLARPARRT